MLELISLLLSFLSFGVPEIDPASTLQIGPEFIPDG